MEWIKRCRIISPGAHLGFGTTRIMAPTPWRRDDKTLRIFCGFCDNAGISRPGFVDVDIRDPSRITGMSSQPILDLGQAGSFDESGVCPSSMVEYEGKLRMYYFGFQKTARRPVPMFSGLAISDDGGETFHRLRPEPIFGPTPQEPLTRSAPYVDYFEDIFHAYYPCALGVIRIGEKPIYRYHLRYLSSEDGCKWGPLGRVAVDLAAGEDEYGLGRPWVMRAGACLRLLYSVRTRSLGYRLGFAESENGRDFIRRDAEMGISVSASESDWDAEMICYGATCKTPEKTFLFYNGNGLGNTGFGFAELVSES